MNLDQHREALRRQLALIRSLKPKSRAQVQIIDAMSSAAESISLSVSVASQAEETVRAAWQQLQHLQAAFTTLYREQAQPVAVSEDTAEIDVSGLIADEDETEPALPPQSADVDRQADQPAALRLHPLEAD